MNVAVTKRTLLQFWFCSVADGEVNVLDDILTMEDDFDDEREVKKEPTLSGRSEGVGFLT